MKGLSKALRLFLLEAFVRSGKSVIERDFRETLQWDKNNEFRDDNEIDQLEDEVKKVAQDYVNQIMDKLTEEGFETEDDIITRKSELSILLERFMNGFESELREGEVQ